MPSLAHGWDGRPRDVVGLNGGAIDEPGLRPAPVGKVTDEPMAGDRGGHPHTDPPDDEWPAAAKIEPRREGDLLQHPTPLQPAVEAVGGDGRRRGEHRRPVQTDAAMELSPSVAEHRAPVTEIAVARRLALGPIARVVDAHHAERAVHADHGRAPDQDDLQPERALEASVDQAPMQSDRVAEQQGRGGEEQKDPDSAPGKGDGRQRHGRREHAAVPG